MVSVLTLVQEISSRNKIQAQHLPLIIIQGAMFGAFINGPIADRFSRKSSILYANIVFLIGSILQCAAQNVLMIFFGRFFAGISIGMLAMVTPLYLSELSPVEKLIFSRKKEGGCDEVLNGRDDRLSVSRRDKVVFDVHQLQGLSAGFLCLRNI